MTTLEKLERLVKEKLGYVGTDGLYFVGFRADDQKGWKEFAPTLTEAIDKAYEAAFPTRRLEPGDIFAVGNSTFRWGDDGLLKLSHPIGWVMCGSTLRELTDRGFTIIGKALDEPVEVKP